MSSRSVSGQVDDPPSSHTPLHTPPASGGHIQTQAVSAQSSVPVTIPSAGGDTNRSSSQQGGRPESPGRDLSSDLVDAGWRRFWSRREKRFYYFNKFTNQSLWDLPVIGGSPQSWANSSLNSIATPSPSSVMSPPSLESSANMATPDQVKRRRLSSSLDSAGAKATFTFTSPAWNLEIPSNVVIHEREMTGGVYPPLPAVELLRASLMAKLRQQYQEMCHSRQAIDAPAESFNRWLLERKVLDRGPDPLLPSDCPTEVSPSMFREIMNDIPVKLVTPHYTGEARRQLGKYAEAAIKVIDSSRSVSADSRKHVKWHVEDVFRWQRQFVPSQHNAKEPYLERLAHLKKQCHPHIIDAAKDGVEGICRKMNSLAAEDVRKVREKQATTWKELGINELAPRPVAKEHKVRCYPVLLSIPSPALPQTEVSVDGEYTSLKCEGRTVQLATSYFYKLEQLYKANCKDDDRHYNFPSRVWCLLRRYQTYYGVLKADGQEQQAALPIPVFECLNRLFGVTFECFASPLNCYYNQYCSAFPDTDGYFGSRGSMLDFYPKSGSFEVNPPFCEELMEAMIDHIESLLGETHDPLSFIVFIPEWKDPPTEAHLRMDSSRFKRGHTVIGAYDHDYRHGFQHVCPRSELNIKSMHGTEIFFLQNGSGAARWGPTDDKIAELERAFVRKPMTGQGPGHV